MNDVNGSANGSVVLVGVAYRASACPSDLGLRNQQDLQPSHKLRRTFERRVARVCKDMGIPLLGGWAIPKERVRDLDEKLKALRAEYSEAVAKAGDRTIHYDAVVTKYSF